MPKSILQFHALPSEVAEYARTCASDGELSCAGSTHRGIFAVTEIRDLVRAPLTDFSRIYLNTVPFTGLGTASITHFLDANPCSLVFDMPEDDNRQLTQASAGFTCVAPEDTRIRKWRGSLSRIRRLMVRGAWVVNKTTGARQYYASLLATRAAIEHSRRSGTRMVQFRNGNEFLFSPEP